VINCPRPPAYSQTGHYIRIHTDYWSEGASERQVEGIDGRVIARGRKNNDFKSSPSYRTILYENSAFQPVRRTGLFTAACSILQVPTETFQNGFTTCRTCEALRFVVACTHYYNIIMLVRKDIIIIINCPIRH